MKDKTDTHTHTHKQVHVVQARAHTSAGMIVKRRWIWGAAELVVAGKVGDGII